MSQENKIQIVDVAEINEMILQFSGHMKLRQRPDMIFLQTGAAATSIFPNLEAVWKRAWDPWSARVYRDDGTPTLAQFVAYKVFQTIKTIDRKKPLLEEIGMMGVFRSMNNCFEPIALFQKRRFTPFARVLKVPFFVKQKDASKFPIEYRPGLEKLFEKKTVYKKIERSDQENRVLVICPETNKLIVQVDRDFKFYEPAQPTYRYDDDDEIEEYWSDETSD